MHRRLLAVLLATFVANCAHVRPHEVADCRLKAIPLRVGTVHPRELGPPAAISRGPVAEEAAQTPFEQLLVGQLMRTSRDPAEASQPKEVLVLSGGSQNGLFGTGLFYGLPSVPTYRIVTGVSTGALQSTMIFLANQPVPQDRTYPEDRAYRHPDIQMGRSNLDDFAASSLVSSEASLLDVGGMGMVGALARGSVASLEPLRRTVHGLISPETLFEISRQRASGRSLYVGVTDLDDGNGYAIDLTELASRVSPRSDPAQIEAVRWCYTDALLASSSVPLAAYPVSLSIQPWPTREVLHHLFVDGGARYGVFLKQIEQAAVAANNAARSSRSATKPQPTNVTLIVNGRMYSTDWRDRKGLPVDKWSALSVGQRSVSLLINQVYRFSIDQVETVPRSGGGLNMAFISNEKLGPGAEDPDQHVFYGKTCEKWSEEDEKAGVQEFHPNFMACLFDYGRTRGAAGQWNVQIPPTLATAPR